MASLLGRRDRGSDGPPRVVVVSDDQDAGTLLRRLLEAAPQGWQASLVPDQLRLSEQLSERPARAVVVDIATGGIGGGLKVLDFLRGSPDAAVAATPVVLVTPTASSAMYSWQAGVDELLVRPFHARELVAAVEAAMNRRDGDRVKHRRAQLEAARSSPPTR